MKYFWLYLIALMALCLSCRTSKQVQLEQHVIENSVDTTISQSVSSSHAAIDSTITSVGGKDVVVDIVETIEHFDSLGRVTQKHTKTTNIHHKDSVTTVKDSHKILADTVSVGKLQISRKNTDSTIKEEKKTSFSSWFFEGLIFVIAAIVITAITLYVRHLICKL